MNPDFAEASNKGAKSLASKIVHSKASSKESGRVAYIRASLKVVEWVNETVDATVRCLGKHGTREASMVLLILHKENKDISGKRLVQRYRTWTATPRSLGVEESLRVAMGRLLQLGHVEVQGVGEFAISRLKGVNSKKLVGILLEEGLHGLTGVQLTVKGVTVIKAMRRTIDERLNSLVRDLGRDEKRVFKRLIGKSLPSPPRKANAMTHVV